MLVVTLEIKEIRALMMEIVTTQQQQVKSRYQGGSSTLEWLLLAMEKR